METYGVVAVEIHVFLSSALVGSEWSASRLGRYNSGEGAPVSRWIESWVGSRAALDAVEKRIF
jgi:hypothetical protein